MKKAIAMKCTQEDWDSIKDRIPKEMTINITSFENCCYLTNFFKGRQNVISNISNYGLNDHNRTIHETFNTKTFLEACGIETDVYEITKEQVLELHNIGYTGREELLEKWFPDAFKKELDKNFTGWVKINSELDKNWLMYFENGIQKYGFDSSGNFMTIETKEVLCGDEFESTPQEVESALISECLKKYKIGDTIKPLDNYYYGGNEELKIENLKIKIEANTLFITISNGYNIGLFKNGQWATIIQPEKMTLEQIEKELGRKIQIV